MQASPVARVIISISAMLFAGFAMTRITRRLCTAAAEVFLPETN